MCIRNYKYSCLKHKVSKIYSKTNAIMEVFCNFAENKTVPVNWEPTSSALTGIIFATNVNINV